MPPRRKGTQWSWEARSVNARGLDLRLRLAEGFESLEAPLRAAIGAEIARGAVTVGAARRPGGRPDAAAAQSGGAGGGDRGGRGGGGSGGAAGTGARADHGRGSARHGRRARWRTRGAGGQRRAARGRRGAGRAAGRGARRGAPDRGRGAQAHPLRSDRADRDAGRRRARHRRGAGHADRARRSGHGSSALLAAGAPVDEARLAQELALLAVKADVTEELDRLDAHVAAARELLAAERPVGRRLDFLMQELNQPGYGKAACTDLCGGCWETGSPYRDS